MLYLDCNSNYHLIKSCAIANLSDLQSCFEKLASTTNPQSKASLLELIAKLSGVSFELLASDIEGVLGAIAEVNFQVEKRSEPKSTNQSEDSEPKKPITLQKYQYQLVTSLVNAELAVDLESALKIASEIPYKDIEGYLTIRINFLNQDKIKEQEKEKFIDQKIEEVKEEIADGSFFKGLSEAMAAQRN